MKMKRKILLLSSLLFCLLALVGCTNIFGNAPKNIEQAKDSVVRVETDIGTGSGFSAVYNNWIITNYHVVDGAKSIYVVNNDNVKKEIKAIALLDPDLDIAILRTNETYTPLPLGDGKSVKEGDDVTVIGSPKGLLNTVSVGKISNENIEDHIMHSAPVSPGSSGGVLLNDKHEVIGVINATAADEFAQNLNFAINVEDLKEIVEQYKSGESRTESYPPKDKVGEVVGVKLNNMKFYYKELLFVGVRDEYQLTVSLGDDGAARVDVVLEMNFRDSEGKVLYYEKIPVKASDFIDAMDYGQGKYNATVAIPFSKIEKADTSMGELTVKLIYKNKQCDTANLPVSNLPINENSFKTLIFSGNGPGYVDGIDLPYGTYRITITYSGSNRANIRFDHDYGGTFFDAGTSYITIRPKGQSTGTVNVSTPLYNGYFNILKANGAWTVKIERQN